MLTVCCSFKFIIFFLAKLSFLKVYKKFLGGMLFHFSWTNRFAFWQMAKPSRIDLTAKSGLSLRQVLGRYLFPDEHIQIFLIWKYASKQIFQNRSMWTYITGFKLAICNSQFAKRFGSLRMSFCIFSKNCELLNSDASWIFRVLHWTSYIVSYFKPIKYSLLNNNVISQKFIVHIKFKLHTSIFSNHHFVTIYQIVSP